MSQDRWKQFAKELGGESMRKWSWNWLAKNFCVVARHESWPLTYYITHDGEANLSSDVPNHSTGVQAHFATTGDYRFLVAPKVGPQFIQRLLERIPKSSGLIEGSIGSQATVAFRVGPKERMLLEEFGEEYEAYRKRSHRLIPGLW